MEKKWKWLIFLPLGGNNTCITALFISLPAKCDNATMFAVRITHESQALLALLLF